MVLRNHEMLLTVSALHEQAVGDDSQAILSGTPKLLLHTVHASIKILVSGHFQLCQGLADTMPAALMPVVHFRACTSRIC